MPYALPNVLVDVTRMPALAQSPIRFALALSLALICHLVVLVLLGRMDWSPEPLPKTSVTLIVTRSEVTASEQRHSRTSDQTSVTSQAGDTPIAFQAPRHLPQHQLNPGVPTPDTNWIDQVFAQRELPVTTPPDPNGVSDQVRQTQTEPFRILSPYHQQLLQLLSRHQQAFDSLDRDRRVLMTLKIHPSGALLRATIKTSSGDADVDAAAQRTAYAASPFPPPPASDEALDYLYPVEILYRRGQ